METTIEHLAAAAGRYEGTGDGAESGSFAATIEIRPLLDGLGVEIDYEATDDGGQRLHAERTVLAFDSIGGEPTLYVLCEELRGMAQLSQVAANRFGNGAGEDGFDLEIEIGLDDDELTYVWSWGPPHEPTVERSRAVLRRTDGPNS